MRLIFLFLFILFSAPLSAQVMPSYKMTKQYSVRQLEEWLKKNVRPGFINPANFDVAFQINTGWKYTHDLMNSVSLVGFSAGRPSNSYFANLTVDYDYSFGRFSLVARTSFRNSGGLFGGTARNFELERGYISWRITVRGPFSSRLDAGRRSLTKIYNSQMQFTGRADGLTFINSYLWDKVFDARVTGGIYIFSVPRGFGLLRAGLFNIADLGFYFDFAYSYWGDNRPPGATNNINIKYNLTQYLVGWDYKPKWLNKDIKVFGALIKNVGATANFLTNGSKESMAGYVGLQLGSAKKQGNYSFQFMLQTCALQAIPPWDMDGIGIGRAPVTVFTATNIANANTNTNFKGWEGAALYAVTDQLTLTMKLQRSVTRNQAIGQPKNFTTYKLETQYIF